MVISRKLQIILESPLNQYHNILILWILNISGCSQHGVSDLVMLCLFHYVGGRNKNRQTNSLPQGHKTYDLWKRITLHAKLLPVSFSQYSWHTHLVMHRVKHWYFFVPQFHCINNTAAGVAAAAGFTEVCLQSSEAHTSNQPGGGPKIRIYFRFWMFWRLYLVSPPDIIVFVKGHMICCFWMLLYRP